MKKFAFLILIVFSVSLAACSEPKAEPQELSLTVEEPQQENRPKIPQSKKLKASALQYKEDEIKEETDLILEAIEGQVGKVTISEEDIARGYYFSSKKEKKAGTPNTWSFIEDGVSSRYASEAGEQRYQIAQNTEACQQTGGEFELSCNESEGQECKNIPESQCICPEGSTFESFFGCHVDDAVSQRELRQGYYLGEKHQKKLNTPENWAWTPNNGQPRWQIQNKN